MTELVHEKKTREIGAGDVVSRGALPELPRPVPKFGSLK